MRPSRHLVSGRPGALTFMIALVACSAVQPDAGLDASLRVLGAQFYRGATPSPAAGPIVESVDLVTNTIRAGLLDKSLSAALAPEGTAAAVRLAGDPGYWVIPGGPPAVDTPSFPSVRATMEFAPSLLPGAYDLTVQAVDGSGRFGPPSLTTLTATEADLPPGPLVVSLAWDTQSDLDLHLLDPAGVEVYYGHINSWVPPGPGQPPADPDAWMSGGILDFDSNEHCVIDGRRREHVVWTEAAPAGHYVARVDTFSLCGQPDARWTVTEYVGGQARAHAAGIALPSDTRGDHGVGAGVTAVEFDLP